MILISYKKIGFFTLGFALNFSFLFGCDRGKEASEEKPASSPVRQSIRMEEGATSLSRLQAMDSNAATIPSKLSGEDVFFASEDQLPLYRSEQGDDIICYLSFGDQLLIRARSANLLKVRLDLFAITNRACPSSLVYAFVKLGELTSPADQTANHPRYKAVTLAEDLAVYADSAMSQDPVCTLAKGNAVLVSEKEHTLQMPISASCDPEVLLGYFHYHFGLWLEDHPD